MRQNIAIRLDSNLISVPNVTHSNRTHTVVFKLQFLFHHCKNQKTNMAPAILKFTKCVDTYRGYEKHDSAFIPADIVNFSL